MNGRRPESDMQSGGQVTLESRGLDPANTKSN